ncbi:hypothetical protein [Leptospira yasudae]|uniref:hypothetical protein n=1 Tax=Leptospira yasudae TaxID=2202201 RepID=UPI00143860F2|nr:hypothetical protein [Leptospira yasudae]
MNRRRYDSAFVIFNSHPATRSVESGTLSYWAVGAMASAPKPSDHRSEVLSSESEGAEF